MNVIVIGGGASGLMAALTALSDPSSVFPVSGPGRAGRFFGRPAILA